MAHVTIPAVDPFITYVGDGTTQGFPFPFPFFDAEDISVYVDGVEQGGDYAISGDALDGGFEDGTVTFTTAPASAAVIVLVRRLDIERVTDFPYPSQVLDIQALNTELDRIVAMIQGQGLDSRRALRVPVTEITVNEVPGKTTRANKILGFDGDGQPVALSLSEGELSAAQAELLINSILQQLLPVGIICRWYGSVASIPSGWSLCNGSGGTPDLRNRFVIGAGGSYAPHATGGAATATSTAAGSHNHGGSTGSHVLTVGEMPRHKHGLGNDVVKDRGSGGTITGSGVYADGAAETDEQGNDEAHSHTIPTQADHTHDVATMPPYYALCYIMRTAGFISGDGGEWGVTPEVLQFAVSDETTAIEAGTAKITLRMPFAMTLQEARASLGTASSSGAVTIDINMSNSSVFSTLLTIDEGEKTSTTAAVPAVISTAALTDDAEITIDIDGAGTDAAGLKVVLIGLRA